MTKTERRVCVIERKRKEECMYACVKEIEGGEREESMYMCVKEREVGEMLCVMVVC